MHISEFQYFHQKMRFCWRHLGVRNLLFVCLLTVVFACQPPNIPVGGSYTPIQKNYAFGDEVHYSCSAGYLLMGRDIRSCSLEGKWTHEMPFCDLAMKLKNPEATYDSENAYKATDMNTSSCFNSIKNIGGETFSVHLEKAATINVIRLYLLKGNVKLDVKLGVNHGVKFGHQCNIHNALQCKYCCIIQKFLDENQWVEVRCTEKIIFNSIYITETSDHTVPLKICEVEVYVKDDEGCNSPPDIYVPNGYLQVSRRMALLKCADGYKPNDSDRLICVKTTAVKQQWSGKIMQCNAKEPKTARIESKTIIIAVSVVVSAVLISCTGLILFLIFRKKSKPMIVVLQPGETLRSVQSNGTTEVIGEGEYSSITYDELISTQSLTSFPQPPLTRPPVGMMKDYSKPADHYPPPYNVNHTYTEPLQSTFKSISRNDSISCRSMKSSPLYEECDT